ncbi:unnamed protein product [Pylaiella littoralis]
MEGQQEGGHRDEDIQIVPPRWTRSPSRSAGAAAVMFHHPRDPQVEQVIGDESAAAVETLLSSPPPAAAAAAAGREVASEVEVTMPVADVMALLQAMREEQLDSLKRIADGVQQLQSQVMVLGESASASEGNTSLVLDRLAALEVRIGSIPVPMKPAFDRAPPYPTQQQQQPRPRPFVNQDVHAGGGVGVGVGGIGVGIGRGSIARIPDFAAPIEAAPPSPVSRTAPPPPPPAAVPGPGRVPTWQGRGEPEPARPHFMRNASPKQAAPVGEAAAPAPAAAAWSAETTTGGGGREGEGFTAGVSSEEAARKEAKRLAFMEDRARIQARIATAKGGGGSAPRPAPPTNASPPAPAAQPRETVQTQPRFEAPLARAPAAGLSSLLATPGGDGGGLFSDSPSFLDGADEGGKTAAVAAAVTGAGAEPGAGGDMASTWLEREKEQRDKRERARREEEERVERQRAEAKRRREEEEAKKLREAEEARAREEARREAEAKKQAKTRVLMSSLFDKANDGNSLFGGLGGPSLLVFDDNGNGKMNRPGGGGGGGASSRTEQAAKRPAASASPPVSEEPSPRPLSGECGGLFGGTEEPTAASSRSAMFGGIEEPTAAPSRGGMFDNLGAPLAERASSPMTGGAAERKGNSGGGGGGGMFVLSPRQLASHAGADDGGRGEGSSGKDIGGAESGLFDSSPSVGGTTSMSSSQPIRTVGAASPKTIFASADIVATDEIDDFLSTLDTAGAPAPSGGGGSSTTATATATASASAAAAVRSSIFGDDEFSGGGGSNDDIFSSAYPSAAGRSAASSSGGLGGLGGSGGGRNNGDSRAFASAGTSLFDRPTQFSIDSGDDDVGNVFGGAGGDSGGANIGGAESDRTSFLTALGDIDLSVGGDDSGEGDAADREGMVEVVL